MLIWHFSMDPDIYNEVGKLPNQHFNVWLFSNPGEKILIIVEILWSEDLRVEHNQQNDINMTINNCIVIIVINISHKYQIRKTMKKTWIKCRKYHKNFKSVTLIKTQFFYFYLFFIIIKRKYIKLNPWI